LTQASGQLHTPGPPASGGYSSFCPGCTAHQDLATCAPRVRPQHLRNQRSFNTVREWPGATLACACDTWTGRVTIFSFQRPTMLPPHTTWHG